MRILIVLDPYRSAVLLVAGDKSGRWNRWYRTAIPEAGLWERAVETAGGPEAFDAAVGRMLDHVVDIAGSSIGYPRYRAVVGDVRDGRAARAGEVQEALTRRGEHRSAGAVDLLIAATAERHQLIVLTEDRDFETVAAVTGQPVRRVTTL